MVTNCFKGKVKAHTWIWWALPLGYGHQLTHGSSNHQFDFTSANHGSLQLKLDLPQGLAQIHLVHVYALRAVVLGGDISKKLIRAAFSKVEATSPSHSLQLDLPIEGIHTPACCNMELIGS